MKIRMKTTLPGSIDGIRVATYSEGVEYDLTASPGERTLAAAFIGADLAEEVKPETKPPEQKVVQAPENKAMAAAPQNKSTKQHK